MRNNSRQKLFSERTNQMTYQKTYKFEFPAGPFEYAIMRKDGALWYGTAHGDERDWSTSGGEWNPYTYSMDGAIRKIGNFPEYFKDCIPIKFL